MHIHSSDLLPDERKSVERLKELLNLKSPLGKKEEEYELGGMV